MSSSSRQKEESGSLKMSASSHPASCGTLEPEAQQHFGYSDASVVPVLMVETPTGISGSISGDVASKRICLLNGFVSLLLCRIISDKDF